MVQTRLEPSNWLRGWSDVSEKVALLCQIDSDERADVGVRLLAFGSLKGGFIAFRSDGACEGRVRNRRRRNVYRCCTD